jgi:hypothetical protein
MMTPIVARGPTLYVEVSVNGSKSPTIKVFHGEGGPLLEAEEVHILQATKREEWIKRLGETHGEAAATELREIVVPLAANFADVLAVRDSPDKSRRGESAALDPWPDPVDGAELADSITAALRRFIVLPRPEHYTAVALWVLFAHAHDAFRFSPLLLVTSPEKASGKSRLLEILSVVTPRAWLTTAPSDAVVFRKIDKQRPTFLLDEADNIGWKDRGEFLAIYNSGFGRRGSVVSRCAGEGANLEPKDYSVWCPKALACIRVPLPDTTVSRSIVLHLRRKMRSEPAEELRDRTATAVFFPLQRQASRWATDHIDVLRQVEPTAPQGLSDRSADAWDPLLAIADTIGGEWPARARATAVLLSGSVDDAESVGAMLLADLHAQFVERDVDRLSTAEILADLTSRDDRPWPEWWGGRALSSRGLARLLKPFGIGPHTVRGSSGLFKGYLKSAFEDAWRRYLPTLSVTSVTSVIDKDLQENLSVTSTPFVTDSELPNHLSELDVTDVTDRKVAGGERVVRWWAEQVAGGRLLAARTIASHLAQLSKRGVQLHRVGDRLEVVAPLRLLPPAAVKYIQENRDALLATLPGSPATMTPADVAARVAVLRALGLPQVEAERQAAEELLAPTGLLAPA